MTAAVTPEPQVVVIGWWRLISLAAKYSRSFSAGLRRPSSISSVKGTLVAPGMWPELRPGRGSGAVPLKRAAERASRTC